MQGGVGSIGSEAGPAMAGYVNGTPWSRGSEVMLKISVYLDLGLKETS